jgi:SPP1 family predicted phage head-tail adaptor
MLRSGSLNRRVILQQQSVTQDAAGQPVNTWVDVATVWASVLLLSGLETIKADRPASIVKASIRIRHRAGVNAGMRVLVGTAVYEVMAVLPDESKHIHIDLACESRGGS